MTTRSSSRHSLVVVATPLPVRSLSATRDFQRLGPLFGVLAAATAPPVPPSCRQRIAWSVGRLAGVRRRRS